MEGWKCAVKWLVKPFGEIERNIEGYGKQVVNKVDIFHRNMIRDLNAHGGEIDYSLDPGLHKIIGGPLGPFGRGGDEADLHIEFLGQLLQPLGAVHFQTGYFFPDLERITVKGPYEHESAFAQNLVPQQGPSQIADPDKGHVPDPIDPQRLLDGCKQILDIIANAADAKLAEVSEIFADLRRIDPASPCQTLRRDDLFPFLAQGFQNLNIGGQALNRSSWNACTLHWTVPINPRVS